MYSGSVKTSIDMYAEITARNISDFENATIGEDGYCSVRTPCSHNQGDCDFHTDCNGTNTYCVENGSPSELGFPPGTDCCHDLCHGFLDMETQMLVFDTFPNSYHDDLQCTGQITVQQGQQITIEFDLIRVSEII